MFHHARRALLVLLALALASRLAAASPVPLTIEKDGRISMTVRVNGSDPLRFRLDTGSTRTLISRRAAIRLALPEVGDTRTLTQAGDVRLALVLLRDVEVAPGLHARGLLGGIVADEALDRAGRVDGLLGQDALAAWPYTIDYRSAQLEVGRPAMVAPDGVTLRLTRHGPVWLAEVPQPGGCTPLQLLPDSGADRLVLYGFALPWLRSAVTVETVQVRSIAGLRAARLVELPDIQVAGVSLRHRLALVLDEAPAAGAMGDGLLPLHLFARASFDLRASSLVLEPRPDAQ